MKHLEIFKSPVRISLKDFSLKGDPVIYQQQVIKNIANIFLDQESLKMISSETTVYAIQFWLPVAEGIRGGLFFGTTTIMPGKVGNEYFMTKGHFHSQSDRAEFSWGVKVEGIVILMDLNRNIWAKEVYAESRHYIW